MDGYDPGQLQIPTGDIQSPKRSYKLLGIFGIIIVLVLISSLWFFNHYKNESIRNEFSNLVKEAGNNSTNERELSDEVINDISSIPILLDCSDNCQNLAGRELIRCAQEESYQSSDFRICITGKAVSMNNSNLCYAIYSFSQEGCMAQVYYIKDFPHVKFN